MKNLNLYKKLNNCEITLNKCKSKFRMSTILLIQSFFILTFTFINLVICLKYQISLTKNQIEEISKQQLHLQNSKALNIQSQQTNDIYSITFSMAVGKMGKLVSLNYLAPLIDFHSIQNISSCREAQQLNEQIQRVAICISYLETQEQQKLNNTQLIQFLNLFEEYQEILDFSIISKQLYFVSPQDKFLTAYYPIKLKNETMELIQYEWFIKYVTELQQSKSPSFSTLFPQVNIQNYEYLLAALAMLMINQSSQINGIALELINLSELSHFLFIKDLNIILVYEDGQILYTQSYIYYGLEKEIKYIFNETVTGFNYTDWELMKSSLNSNFPVYIYNAFLNKSVYIKAKQIPQTPLISLILTNITYENEIQKLLNDQIDSIQNWQITLTFYSALTSVLIILLSFIPLKSIFKPTQVVINMMIKYLLGKYDNKIKDQVISENQLQQIDNVLNKFYQAYQRLDIALNQSQYIKSDHCILIENFFYHENVNSLLNLSFENIMNYNQQISWSEFKQLMATQNFVVG